MTNTIPKSPPTTLQDHLEAQNASRTQHLSAKRLTMTKSSTHLGITISWKFQPPGYLPVTTVVEGAARRHTDTAGPRTTGGRVLAVGGGSAW